MGFDAACSVLFCSVLFSVFVSIFVLVFVFVFVGYGEPDSFPSFAFFAVLFLETEQLGC